jgi:hypothetical protein
MFQESMCPIAPEKHEKKSTFQESWCPIMIEQQVKDMFLERRCPITLKYRNEGHVPR